VVVLQEKAEAKNFSDLLYHQLKTKKIDVESLMKAYKKKTPTDLEMLKLLQFSSTIE
jgi:predicted CopG family antitoxin